MWASTLIIGRHFKNKKVNRTAFFVKAPLKNMTNFAIENNKDKK